MLRELFEGKEIPYICTPLIGKNREEMMEELEKILPRNPDLIEWRADFLEDIHDSGYVVSILEDIKFKAGLPLLFTIRSEKEGGQRISLSEEKKVALLCEISNSKYVDLIDYEVSNEAAYVQELRRQTRVNEKKLVLSYHNFDNTPPNEELLKKLFQAEFYGADIAKAAVMPTNKDDVFRLLQVTKKADEAMNIPIITMSMGSLGALSRMIGWLYGSVVTFGFGVKNSAPGQIPIEELQQMLKMLKKTMGYK
ncbi:type I 3-dehydroquinate dehydratase [Siminovitchia sp. 179-K 8D1 HS]|uniref:type I 3-dehydroquinate dehydratase n=1 Tax=Siminovitchia sp. 179-K 8D1 HS TaxID=3142385 RepID=UPI00399FF7F0